MAETLLKRLEALMAEASDEQALLALQEVGCGHQHRPLSEVDGTMFHKKLWAAHQHQIAYHTHRGVMKPRAL